MRHEGYVACAVWATMFAALLIALALAIGRLASDSAHLRRVDIKRAACAQVNN